MNGPLSRYFPALITDDLPAFLELWTPDAVLFDPLRGTVRNLTRHYDLYRKWLLQMRPKPRLVREWRDRGAPRVACELLLDLSFDLMHGSHWIELPVLLVADLAPDERLRSLRVYHSQWPLYGEHQQRVPFLPARHLEIPDVVGTYQAALAAGDLERVVGTFDLSAGAHVREPSGGTNRGADGLRRFFSGFFDHAHGGLPLRHCEITDDGTNCCLEFFIDHFGPNPCLPQAGGAVYERNAAGTRLISARIYDDFDPDMTAK